MYPIADLTAFCRRTTGDVPPKLVGASTTVVGSKMYLYGGRLVAERRMVSDIYMFDLETFKWEKLAQSPQDDIPQARYFHSADTWNNHLIIFGGMAIQPQSDNPEDLCVLNDVRLFDLSTRRWLHGSSTSGEATPSSFVPKARYAHLSSVTANRLFIVGGQDLNNVWLDDIHVYDLATKQWIQRRDYPRHCGTYRSVAVTADKRVRLPQEEGRSPRSSKLGPPGARFKIDQAASPTTDITSPDSLIHLPYSTSPTEEYPCDIFLFSNYNFTDVQRELEVFSPLPDSDFSISDRSSSMTGTSFPPGLRFPTGAILGTHFIIAGTYLSQTFQSFSVWTLDLINMTWSRIDPGSALVGSWFRSCLWPEANKFLIFGNRHGNLVEDYNRRLLSWDHVAVIDLEAFGIYQPPPLLLDISMQELGLAALEEGVMADFEIICDDGRKVQCSRKVLEDRWPWFKEQRKLFLQAAARALEVIPSTSHSIPLPDVPAASDRGETRPDPRLTPRAFHLSEPYPITLALVQYFYSMALLTPLQHAPAVLSQLLLISSMYNLPHLQSLVKHAMHRALTFATSVGIYGVSTLCNCRSLQIRALRVVMAYSQKRPAGGRSRAEKDGSNGSGGGRSHNPSHGNGGQGPGGGAGPSDRPSAARPRGMSDASYLRGPSEGSTSSGGRGFGVSNEHEIPLDVNVELAKLAATMRPRSNSDTSPIRHHATDSTETARTGSPSRDTASTPLPTQILPSRVRASSLQHRPPAQALPPAPVPMFLHRKLSTRSHRNSIMSLATEQDLHAIAELVSDTVENNDSIAERLETHGIPIPEETDSDVEGFLPSDDYFVSPRRARSSLSPSSSNYPTSSSSLYPESDYQSDDYSDSAYLSSSHVPYPTYHLPRTPGLDPDTPSIRSSTSYSSISTPSLSRASSFHNYNSPASPTSASSLASPVDNVSRRGSLGVIQESRNSEDHDSEFHVPIDEVEGKPYTRTIQSNYPQHDTHHEMVRSNDIIWERRVIPDLERLRIQTISPDTIVPEAALPQSPAPSSADSSSISSSSKGGGGALSRLFGKGDKRPKSPQYSRGLESSLGSPDFNHSSFDVASNKSDEKKRKKEAARARTEALALELEEKAKKRAEAAAAERQTRQAGRKVKNWEDSGGMYGGYSALGGL